MKMDITVAAALDLKNLPASNVITIEEEHFVDASFLIGCILEDRVAKKEKFVFVLHHHGFGHYHGIGAKLGINLQALKDSGHFLVLDVMNEVGSDGAKTDETENWLEKSLEKIYQETSRFLTDISSSSHVTIVLEHPGNIAIAFGNIPTVLNYVRLFQRLVADNVSLICLTKRMPEENYLEVLSSSVQHSSDLVVTVRGLRTGSAHDISGSFQIRRKDADAEDSKNQNEFHFQLQDKKVRVFAPGTVQFR